MENANNEVRHPRRQKELAIQPSIVRRGRGRGRVPQPVQNVVDDIGDIEEVINIQGSLELLNKKILFHDCILTMSLIFISRIKSQNFMIESILRNTLTNTRTSYPKKTT